MQQIARRDWGRATADSFAVECSDVDAALSMDAAVSIVDHPLVDFVHSSTGAEASPCTTRWRSDVAAGNVSVQQLRDEVLCFTCELKVLDDFTSAGISWTMRLRVQSPRVLSGSYRMQPLVHPQHHNGLTPLALQARAGERWVGLLAPDSSVGHDFDVDHAGLVTCTTWLDHPLAHPRFTFEGPQFRNWHNAYRFRAGTVLHRHVYVTLSDTPRPLMVLGRYPGRCRAVFSITDHADHDSCERLAVLWHGTSRSRDQVSGTSTAAGFVGLRLPFTKSVFTATPRHDGAGLHYRPFADLCREGHAAGIEICPHGVHSTRQPAVAELAGLLAPFEEFKPLTWIDHGNHFLSNYGRRGWDPDDEFTLLPWLDRLGIKYVWGRLDFGQSLPRARLDQAAIDRFCGWSYLRDIPKHALRSLTAGRPWAALHGLSSLAFQLVPERTMRQYFLAQCKIQRVMKADVTAIPGAIWQSGKMAAALTLPPGVTDLCRHLGGVREELSRIPIFFPEHDAVYRGRRDRWLFNTIAVHDVAQAYSPAVVEQLLDDYGIHLSHTYLTSTSRAHVSHAIEPDGVQHWRLTQAFAENLRHLAALRDEGRLWVAAMRDVGEFWRLRDDVTLAPQDATTWTLSLPFDGAQRSECDLQIVVIGPTKACRIADRPVDLERLYDDLQLATVRLRAGESLDVECNL